MLDLNDRQIRLAFVGREDRAMLRSNPSARSMPGDGREHMLYHMLLLPCSSFGLKAINLLSWCKAPTKVKKTESSPPVGHMSVFNIRVSFCPYTELSLAIDGDLRRVVQFPSHR
jgi:hypothetical protein